MKTTFIILIGLLVLLPLNAYPVRIGDIAPPFELTDLSGNHAGSGGLKGKVVSLVFWATWCEQCRTELSDLDVLYKKYRQDGFEVVGISLDSSAARIAKFLQKIKPSFRVLHDREGTVADAYRVSGVPVSFIIGRDGVIGRRIMGFGKEFLPLYEKEMKELLKQQ
jgi:peroxiredoxin